MNLNIQLSFDVGSTDEAVSAGNTISGILNVVAPRTVKADKLMVYFRGVEYSKVYVRNGSRVRTYDESHEIIKIDINADKINSVIQQNQYHLPKGQYEIPFDFRISSKLPSSIEFGDCNESTKIEYSLVAEMLGSGIIHDYDTKHIIEVTARPQAIQTVPYEVPIQSHTIMAGLFLDRGRVEFGAHADDTLLVPGQQLNLDLAIVNESLASIHKVRVHLQEFAEWWARGTGDTTGETHTTSRTICLFDELLDASDQFHKKVVDKERRHHVLRQSLRMKQNFQHIEEQLAAAASDHHNHEYDSVLSLKLPPVPQVAHNTYKGNFMKVSHRLTVNLQTHAVNSNPEFQIPIRIMRGRPDDDDNDHHHHQQQQQQQQQYQPNIASNDTTATTTTGVPSIFRAP